MSDAATGCFQRLARLLEQQGANRLDAVFPAALAAGNPDLAWLEASLTAPAGSRENLPPADALLAAAAAGLFPARQPDFAAAAQPRAWLALLERRDYRVRPARPADLAALVGLERLCWAPRLRCRKDRLRQRIRRYPEGQLALVRDGTAGELVAGIIYSQLISDLALLDGQDAVTVEALHDPAGGVAQLLAVNILPEQQQQALGDALLEFMLIWRSQQPPIHTVAAVTLCRNFNATSGQSAADYIRQRNALGLLADPILRFHELHGASIERLMPGYRPADRANQGNGVLVRYDIRNRRRQEVVAVVPEMEPQSLADLQREIGAIVIQALAPEQSGGFAPDRPLMEMGLNSADLLGLRDVLGRRYGLALSPGFFFQHNSVAKLAAAMQSSPEPRVTLPAPLARAPAVPDGDIAIIGMACRLPGGIDSPEALWDCLATGRSVIGQLPSGRWAWPADIDPAGRHRGIDRGGFLADIAAFDAPFFRISPTEAETMDPQQRILLELCWQAIEAAGLEPGMLAGSQTGVFIGASGSDYARLLDALPGPVAAHYGTGSAMSVIANRISYLLDLRGPSLLLDTACSSSMVALHEAVRALQAGEADQALVGGINLMLHPANSIAYYRAGMLSPDGLCRSFDVGANGYVRSEGAVALLLKPLAAALRDGDTIQAVIKGTACNHGGLASGLTVPNPAQQAALLRQAWHVAGIDPAGLGYIEAHGTGTPLGDPIEVEGISQALAGATLAGAATVGLSIGSVKSNLGHLEAAAGLAGLLKAVLCLRHRQLPPVAHFRQVNPEIDLAAASLQVVQHLRDWPAPSEGAPRLAGVSSFGSGGTNAHAVLAECVAPSVAAASNAAGPLLFLFSARTRLQLGSYARHFADWLIAGPGRDAPLADIAAALMQRQGGSGERLAIVAADHAGLADRLRGFTGAGGEATAPNLSDLMAGAAGAAFLAALLAARDLDRLAQLWMAGVDLPTALVLGGQAPRCRLALPGYPFARQRYWLPGQPLPLQSEAKPAEATPLLLVPRWLPVERIAPESGVPEMLLVLGADAAQQAALAERHPQAVFVPHGDGAAWQAACAALPAEAAHILWIAPRAVGGEDLLARQEQGLLALYRLIKLMQGRKHLRLTAITWDCQAVFAADPLDPADAGTAGLLGVVAQEMPAWRIAALDLESGAAFPAQEILAPPATAESLAWRGGQWFERRLAPVAAPDHLPGAYRQGGVYVVIGGAGGLGQAWTRHVVRQYQAQVIWIGRRPQDAAITAQIAEIAQHGPAPCYIVADATQPEALRAALCSIRQRWPQIHGVIHAATGAFDQSIAETDLAGFRAVLAAKLDAAIATAAVFGAEPLDWLLFFSSVLSLERPGGYAGYAAGGAFMDALALHLRQQKSYPVQVMNWGHWDIGTAAALPAASKIRLRQSGILPLQPAEGMAALDRLLALPLGQMACLKSSRPEVLPLLDGAQHLHVAAQAMPAWLPALPPPGADWAGQGAALQPYSLFNNAVLESALPRLLAALLRANNLLDGSVPATAPGYLQAWLAAGLDLLRRQGIDPASATDIETAWQDWAVAKQALATTGGTSLAAAVLLAENCLRALPDILAGRRRATDILFPNASLQQVEGIYRGNAAADYFNALLAERLVALIRERLRRQPDARLRILEVGAGTGATTAAVLPQLASFAGWIAEYAYTDISKAFLFQAEEKFVPAYPFVKPALFDLEKPLEDQGIAAGQYDVVIATNVLHATRSMRRTLAACKAALRGGGVLLLNEICCPSFFAHATFGLLEGWWLAEDRALRLPASPALAPAGWQRLLAQAGFTSIADAMPAAHGLGQQILLAESDGQVWRPVQPAARQPEAAPVVAATPPAASIASDPIEDLQAHVAQIVAGRLRMAPQDIQPQTPLAEYGIDSILIVQITEALRASFPDIASTLLFECRTLAELTAHLAQHERAAAAALIAAPAIRMQRDEPQPQATGKDEPIAVIGMACRFPGARDVAAYWQLLRDGRDAITEVPPERWPLQDFYEPDPDNAVEQGRSYAKWGGFLDGVTAFDPHFFGITPKEAVAIDPQERLFLQTAWHALEDGGYTRDRLRQQAQRRLGVFVGITRTGFDLFGPDLWHQGSTLYPHTSFSSVANRLSFFLDAQGPSMPVDTMCSSSLTAIHMACESLRHGDCALAIAGGVNIYLHPSGYVGLSAARMLSRDGRCRSFGAGGDGFVPGEGVAAILLKPLSRAVADNDRIHAVIRSSHINHGGRTNGYTVPSPQAQADLVRAALLKAGIDARRVGYIEAHGTGTELGDPIEVAGLTSAFRHFTPDSGFCALGSAKTNIGHLEAAAGIAGFIKAVLQMQHRQLAPSLHADPPNPKIDFAATPFRVQRHLADWPAEAGPRIAGISSFGAGGANAHVVIEEYCAEAAVAAAAAPCAIVLSARSEDRLVAGAANLLVFLEQPQPPALVDIAYSLQTGREAMAHRLAFIASDHDEARRKLAAFLADEAAPKLWRGQARQRKDIVATPEAAAALQSRMRDWLLASDWQQLLPYWSQGIDIDWLAQPAGRRRPRQVSLPGYAFAETAYWLPLAPAAAAPIAALPADQEATGITLRASVSVLPPKASGAVLAPLRLRPLAAFAEADAAPMAPPHDHGDGIMSMAAADMAKVKQPVRPAKVLLLHDADRLAVSAQAALQRELRDMPAVVIAEGGDAALGDIRVPAGQQALALDLARDVARAPADLLAALKRHLVQRATMAAVTLPVSAVAAAASGETRRIVLSSEVVELTCRANGVALLRLCDRGGRNTSTPALVAGIAEAFAAIRADARIKVLVLTGYDSYFACGGTREGLLAIQAGQARFTDEQTYALPLLCEIPVIAAMQGHAIGAGWAMGLFCDTAIFSEESVYQCPYMLYGFTPGAGSTLIFPARLGRQLGAEMLLTAREYHGRDLRARGIALPVLPRQAVLPHALALADVLAQKQRVALIEEKTARVQALRAALQPSFAAELALHDRFFVGNQAVIDNVARHFGRGLDIAQPAIAPSKARSSDDLLLPLRHSLAEELQLDAANIDVDMPFVDIGIDSISAVTWIRRINRDFGCALPATIVYSHPTLAQLAAELSGHAAPPVAKASPAPQSTDGDDLLPWLRAALARELALSTDAIEDDAPFVDLGLDSVTAVTWIRAINREFGLGIAATSVYSHPNLAMFSRYLHGLMPGQPQPTAPLLPPSQPAKSTHPAIAIIGMAGQFPKASDIGQFWRNILAGLDCVSEIPARRWCIDDYYDPDRTAPGKTVCRRMGSLDDAEIFDPLFFGISPAEAEFMDPQQRLFLQSAWHSIEDAGYDPHALSGQACGVFVGVTAGDYAQLGVGLPQSAQGLIGESVSILPARIAYMLNLQGPCLAIDTACSASLVAISNACDSLLLGNSDLALAGGVYVITGPDIHVKMSKAGMLSPDGRCHSFDERANGFVPGEGAAVLLLKRLADAERDGDDIRAVIRGWGVNQDGRTNGITAPSQTAQTRLEVDIYRRFGIDPAAIKLVEAHGTGTALGDPIEVEALTAAFRHFTEERQSCALGSVKSNIGHLATAAGVAGTIKAVLALQHQILPPTIHHETLNQHIRLADSPFYINTARRPWPAAASGAGLAAVSSFGFSGTNAHLVLSAYPGRAGKPSAGTVLLPLAARDGVQLRRYAAALADFLDHNADMPLADIAYTFQVGRPALAQRLAIVAESHAALAAALRHYADTGQLDIPHATAHSTLHTVARRWEAGEAVDWRQLYKTGLPQRRHGLPLYPFARESYWLVPLEKPAEPDPFWQPAALPEGIDWQSRARACLDGRILVLAAPDVETASLSSLVTQLRAAASLVGKPALRQMRLEELTRQETADTVVLLAGGQADWLQSALDRLATMQPGSMIVAGLTVKRSTAASMAPAFAMPRWAAGLLLNLSDTADAVATAQAICTEWLAHDLQSGVSRFRIVQIEDGKRWCHDLPPPSALDAPADATNLPGSEIWSIRREWHAQAARAGEQQSPRGKALLLVNEQSLVLARQLFGPADFSDVILAGNIAPNMVAAAAVHPVDFSDPQRARAALHNLVARHDGISHVVDLADILQAEPAADLPWGRVAFYQALIEASGDLTVMHVTAGLHQGDDMRGAAMAALARMLSADYRHVDARHVDVAADLLRQPDRLRALLLQEMDSPLQEAEIRHDGGQRLVPQLSAAQVAVAAPAALAPDAVYVISGGTSGIGLELAAHLASRGCRKLVLLGATALPPRARWPQMLEQTDLPAGQRQRLQGLVALEQQIEQLEILTGALTDLPQLRRYFMRLRATLGPIRGVIHCAADHGDAEAAGFANKPFERLQRACAVKAQGLLNLEAVFRADALDFLIAVVPFSGLVPHFMRGSSDAALANGLVEYAMAQQQQSRPDCRVLTLAWPDWSETGAVTRLPAERKLAIAAGFDRIGMRLLSNHDGRAVFDAALAGQLDGLAGLAYLDYSRFAVAQPQLSQLRPEFAVTMAASDEATRRNTIRQQIEIWQAEKRSGHAITAEQVTAKLSLAEIRRLEPALIGLLHGLLFDVATMESDPAATVVTAEHAALITATVMELLKLKELDPSQPFQNYGLDSISATMLAMRLEKKLGRDIAPRLLIDYPSVEALSRHLAESDAGMRMGAE